MKLRASTDTAILRNMESEINLNSFGGPCVLLSILFNTATADKLPELAMAMAMAMAMGKVKSYWED